MSTDTIPVDRETYKDLRKAYQEADKMNALQFQWRGRTVLVQYAYYLLQYMEDKLKINNGIQKKK